MSRIFVRGVGAVSPAGWGARPLLDALRANTPLPVQELAAPSGRRFPVRLVPPHTTRPAWLAHPRLRRASSISHFALAAALEALDPWPGEAPGTLRLGIVTGTFAASMRYSERFFGEVLQNPATASPLLFPETVINAPASHVAAFLGCSGLCYSLIADQTAFVQALLVGCDWLLEGRVDACLVLGMDEAAWPVAEALGQFSHRAVLSEGAGAVLLAREPDDGPVVELERVTDAHLHARAATKLPAAQAMRRQLPAARPAVAQTAQSAVSQVANLRSADASSRGADLAIGDTAGWATCATPGHLLVDSCCGAARLDHAEAQAWADWQGARLSPRCVLGEALSAATAWQCVAAHAALSEGTASAANISVVGGNLQAIGARLVRREVAVAGTR